MRSVRSRVRVWWVLGAALSIAVSGAAIDAQDTKPSERKLSKEERVEFDTLAKAVDAVMAGQPGPAELGARWQQEHYIKAQEQKTYVPFTLALEPGASAGSAFAMYVRLAARGAAAAPPAGGEAKPAAESAEYAFENVHFLEARAEADKSILISRAFSVPAGEYDVFVALRERPVKGKNDPLKMSVVKHEITVPDFWNEELTASSVILAARAETVTTQVTQEQQADNPYTLGSVRIVPSLDMAFTKAGELNIIFWIYNPAVDGNKKPDVTIDYAFHQKVGEVEKYFNRTRPQKLDAGSLPPEFDLAAGYQLPGGQTIPLASFPEGEYRLEIKVTDNLSKKTITRDVRFSVSA